MRSSFLEVNLNTSTGVVAVTTSKGTIRFYPKVYVETENPGAFFILQRGASPNHEGTKISRKTIASFCEMYHETNKDNKRKFACNIVSQLRQESVMPVKNLVHERALSSRRNMRALSSHRKMMIELYHQHSLDEIVSLAPDAGEFYVETGNDFAADVAMKILRPQKPSSQVDDAATMI